MDSFESDGQVTYTNQDLQEMDQRPIAHDRVRLQKDMLDFLRNFSETGGESFPYRTLHPRPLRPVPPAAAPVSAAPRPPPGARAAAAVAAPSPSAAGNGGRKKKRGRMNGGS